GKRTISIDPGEIDRLVVPNGFDIDLDPVTLNVTVATAANAKPLPKVKLTMPTRDDQLLWLVGPVYLLGVAIATQTAAISPNIAPPKPNWRDSVRWSSLLGAQCRTVKTRGSC